MSNDPRPETTRASDDIVEATSPVATDPVAADPVATDPVATDPLAADPLATDPLATDPVPDNPVPTNPSPETGSERVVEIAVPIEADSPKRAFRRGSTVSVTREEYENINKSYNVPSYVIDAHRNMMDAALYDAGRFCYGVKRIEVWLFDAVTNRLKQPWHGTWTDPVYNLNEDEELMNSLEEIDKEDRSLTYAPGEGLPGILWTESNIRGIFSRATELNESTAKTIDRFANIQWRDVKALADDPDQPYNPRLMTIAKAGFRLAAGVTFNIRSTKGVVIFMARDSVDRKKLKNLLNHEYILASAEHIGSVQALRKPRRLATEERRKDVIATFQKFKKLLPLLKNYGKGLKDDPQSTTEDIAKPGMKPFQETKGSENNFWDKIESTFISFKENTVSRLKLWEVRMHGGNVQPPPGMRLETSLFVVFAAFCTCFIMAILNTVVKNGFQVNSNPDDPKSAFVGFEMGQIASAATMVFTLTSAPAAQPRSIVLGRLVSLLVGMTFALIPGTSYDDPLGWIRYAGAVSVASALMAKLGLAHPPGGGLANTFAFKYGWGDRVSFQKIGILLIQDLVFVYIAAMFNNLGDTKPYPTFWGHLPNKFSQFVRSCVAKEKNE